MSVVIVAIVVMAIAVPVIAGAGTTTETKENEYTYRATLLDTSTGTHTLNFSYSNTSSTGTVTINGVEIGTISTAVLIGPEVTLKWISTNSRLMIQNTGSWASDYVEVINAKTITITDGKWTGASGNEISVPSIIVPSEEGELGAMESGKVSPGSTCYWAQYDSYAKWIYGYGDPWQPTQIKAFASNLYISGGQWSGTPSAVTTSDVGETSMTVGSLTFDEKIVGVFSAAPLMYIPIEYTGTTSGVTGTVKTLVDMIPLLMIVGLMVATVAAYIRFRSD